MTRRVSLPWPKDGASTNREPVRLLAVSDEPDRALDFERNREQIGRIDAVLGCGDLEPDYLCFLADAFHVPLHYVLGNHDRGAAWHRAQDKLPGSLTTKAESLDGIDLVGLSWPGERSGRHASRDEWAAWRQALLLGLRPPRRRPLVVLSHVPPRGLGDTPEDDYHRGFAAYEWLCRRLHPTVWLHGHTNMAAARDWRVQWGETTFINVTGAVLVEIGGRARPDAGATMSVPSGGAS